jgi:hypothetical protein
LPRTLVGSAGEFGREHRFAVYHGLGKGWRLASPRLPPLPGGRTGPLLGFPVAKRVKSGASKSVNSGTLAGQSQRDCITQPSVGPPGQRGVVLRWESVAEQPSTLKAVPSGLWHTAGVVQRLKCRLGRATAKGAKSVLPHLAQSQDQRKTARALEPCAQLEFQSAV